MRISKNVAIAFMGLLVVCCILGTYIVEQGGKKTDANQSASPNSTNVSSNSNSNDEETISSSNEESNQNSNVEQPSNSNSNSNSTSNSNVNSSSNSNTVSPGSQENVAAKNIRVENRCGDVTAQVIDEYYQDSEYIYYFSSLQSGCVYVIVNQKDYTIKEALNSKVVTPAEIEATGYKLLKRKSNTSVK